MHDREMMMIIGRQYEQKQLGKLFQSKQAEFIAVYGRRRVGKTFLIRKFFEAKRCVFFQSVGVHKGTLKNQLLKFKQEIETTFYRGKKGSRLSDFSNWHGAFQALTDAIDLFVQKQKVVIFLDEIPWMATPKSGLIEALGYYWNRYWSNDGKIKLIICGSAASWIINNILRDTGGLHNRVTLRLPIEPFSLDETQAYLHHRGIRYNQEQIVMLYMCLGGIPFYHNFIEKGLSAIQNVNNACFQRKGTLYDEFDLLFASLFKEHEFHKDLITYIASKRHGISRSDIEHHFKCKGGRLSERLTELEEAGFIHSYIPWKKGRGIFYKVIDEYTLFYLTWIAPQSASRLSGNINEQYWEAVSNKSAWKAWSGYTFESICYKHIDQIKRSLNIPDGSEVSSWTYIADTKEHDGVQIDLLFSRPDGIVNLCEIKYCKSPFKLDKKYMKQLMYREELYNKVFKTNKQIFHSMIVSGGLKKNMYSEHLITGIVTLDDLFKPKNGS